MRKATYQIRFRIALSSFQSTPSLRKATIGNFGRHHELIISIHTFLAEGDGRNAVVKNHMIHYFNPHLPCGRRPAGLRWLPPPEYFNPHLPCGRRLSFCSISCCSVAFQSTPSLRKATHIYDLITAGCVISIHTFLAEGDSVSIIHHLLSYISIHTFLAEGDRFSRPTADRADISIHTFLAEGDVTKKKFEKKTSISIHTFLAEGDLHMFGSSPALLLFQSTPSLRKATIALVNFADISCISIHTFLAEGDL